MVTSSSIQYISRLLDEPSQIKEADIKEVLELIRAYPYFLPARYMDAAISHKKQPFNSKMMTTMQLYMGNWLFFCQFMQKALGRDAKMPQVIHAPAEKQVEENIYEPEIKMQVEEITEVLSDADNNDQPANEEAIQNVKHKEAEEYYTETKNPEEDRTIDINDEGMTTQTEEQIIHPIYTEDYFLHQGIEVSNDIPNDIEDVATTSDDNEDSEEEDKSLMVMMSFSEWLLHFKKRTEEEREEQEDKKALKSMWQKEKLAAALEEENDEIPEDVFEMAVNSITKEDDLISESLAEIYAKQGKYEQAIKMYHKLSLRNPQKNTYFARKIEELLKEK